MRIFATILFQLFFIITAIAGDTLGDFYFEKTVHDFGVIIEGERPYWAFKFKNISKDTIKFNKTHSARNGLFPLSCKPVVPPNEEGTIALEYPSPGRPGRFVKTITVFNPSGEPIHLFIKGIVIKPDTTALHNSKYHAKIKIDSTTINLGLVPPDKELKKKVLITNQGKDTLKILDLKSYFYSDTKYRLVTKKNKEVSYLLPKQSATFEIPYTPYHNNNGGGYDEVIFTLFTNDPLQRMIPILLRMKVADDSKQ